MAQARLNSLLNHSPLFKLQNKKNKQKKEILKNLSASGSLESTRGNTNIDHTVGQSNELSIDNRLENIIKKTK
jgi:hypothetical protein